MRDSVRRTLGIVTKVLIAGQWVENMLFLLIVLVLLGLAVYLGWQQLHQH